MKASTFQSSHGLSLDDIYPALDACPICGYEGKRKSRSVIQRAPEIALLECPRCKGLSASHMPTREALNRYYESYYAHWQAERVTFHKPDRLARHIVCRIRRAQGEALRILDFGGGDGTISRLVAQHLAACGYNKIAVQVVDYVTAAATRESGTAIEFVSDIALAAGACDLVIASAIFEHVPQLGPVMAQVAGKMRPGGLMYARTPYMLPFIRLLRVDMTYPGHVHDLGDAFWNCVPSWLRVPVEIVHSAPSIVETGFEHDFMRTLAAYCLKLPARVSRAPLWKFYGGWEVILRRKQG
jgi:SAM-dependent methyltransferase